MSENSKTLDVVDLNSLGDLSIEDLIKLCDKIKTEKKDKVAAVISAISQTMTCDKCPFPCEAKEHSSYQNCNWKWWETLHELGVDVSWEDVRDPLFSIFDEHGRKGGFWG